MPPTPRTDAGQQAAESPSVGDRRRLLLGVGLVAAGFGVALAGPGAASVTGSGARIGAAVAIGAVVAFVALLVFGRREPFSPTQALLWLPGDERE